MIRPYLARRDFEELVILRGLGDETPAAIRERLIAAQYPATTPGAVAEMKSRGIDADLHRLHRAMRAGKFPEPAGEGRVLQWGPDDIDRAVEAMFHEGNLTPWGFWCLHDGVDAAEDLRARIAAESEFPNVPLDDLVREILPGVIGRGVGKRVRYRRMTDAESGELETLLAEVDSAS